MTTRISSTLPGAFASVAIVVTCLIAGAGARAETVSIAGKHGRAEIAEKCTASGGAPFNTGGSSGSYGCLNTQKDTYVECTNKGKCISINRTAPTGGQTGGQTGAQTAPGATGAQRQFVTTSAMAN